ncbi:fructoselysine 6-kinase [Olegusella massiliensis]|uniref:fructoselysine 6-kinase n=1 Tax=Olegusella massiliensis TaxID=1776381 RepID=UPI00083872D0|nr:fructoselysine 6-kinase [Olegusella massiliensis]
MKVAAVGDNCVDVYENEGKQYPGGNPVNVSVYLKRMGIDASYTGVVGNDAYGKGLVDALSSKGVDVSHVHVEPGSTAITKVEIVNGNRVFGDYIEGVMEDFKVSEDDLKFLCSHDLVVSGIWGHTTDALAAIKESGTTVVFDYSDQPHDPIVDSSIANVDYAFFGLEARDTEEVRNFMREKQAMGPKVVIVTLGEYGSLAFDGENFYSHGIIPVKIADTMGAGDSFIAGYIKGILEGKDVSACMEEGAQSSAVTIQYNGAW